MTLPRPLEVRLEFVAQTYDIDFAGIVHNLVYIRWLEDLRLQILEEHYPLPPRLAAGIAPVLERTEITYHSPLRLLDRPVGRMWISNLKRARWELEAEFTLDDRKVCSARQTGYFIELDRMRPVRVPDELRVKWQASLDDATSGA